MEKFKVEYEYKCGDLVHLVIDETKKTMMVTALIYTNGTCFYRIWDGLDFVAERAPYELVRVKKSEKIGFAKDEKSK